MTLTDVAQQQKVAGCILLISEQGPDHFVGGIVNGSRQRQARSAPLQPVVDRGIQLQEHADLRVTLPSLVIPPPPILVRTGQPRCTPDAPHTGPRYPQPVFLLEHFTQVLIVVVLADTLCQGQDLFPSRWRQPARRRPATV